MEVLLGVLSYPFTLLIAGAAFSGWLLPRVARGWQDQRKALEVKAILVERVTRAVMDVATASQFALVGATSQSQEDFDKAYRMWQLEKSILTSIIGAYFRKPDVLESWLRCRALSTAYYVQVGVRRSDPEATEAARGSYLRSVAAGLDRSPPEDRSEDPRSFETPGSAIPNGLALVDVVTLREELERALTACVATIVDSRMNLTTR